MNERELLQFIKTSANYFSKLYQAKGVDVDPDDVEGELGLAYTKALPAFNPEAGASLKTYMSEVFKNHMVDYIRSLLRVKRGMMMAEPPPKDDLFAVDGMDHEEVMATLIDFKSQLPDFDSVDFQAIFGRFSNDEQKALMAFIEGCSISKACDHLEDGSCRGYGTSGLYYAFHRVWDEFCKAVTGLEKESRPPAKLMQVVLAIYFARCNK